MIGRISQTLTQCRQRAPLLGTALGAVAGALWGEEGTSYWCWVALGLGCALAPGQWRGYLAVVGLAVLVAWRAHQTLPQSLVASGEELSLSGELIVGRSDPAGSRRGILETDAARVTVLLENDSPDWEVGDRLTVVGILRGPVIPRNPGIWDEGAHWRLHRISGRFTIVKSEPSGVVALWWPLRLSERCRSWVRTLLGQGLAPDSHELSIMRAMVLGEKPPPWSPVQESFRHSGLMHVFAVSGLHVNAVGVLVWFLLAPIRLSRRSAALVVIGTMIFYALLTGARPPAVRAALMGAFFLGGVVLGRRTSILNILALSLLLSLICLPAQIGEIGFQLSHAVVAAIALGFAPFYSIFERWTLADPFMPSELRGRVEKCSLAARRFFAAALVTSISAWIGSLPWMAGTFALVAPISILASVIVIPLAFGILSLALVTILLPFLAPVTNSLNAVLAGWSHQIAQFSAQVPGGHFVLKDRPPADLVILDVADSGAASWVRGGMLVDCGSRSAAWTTVRPFLRNERLPLQSVVVTHADGQHVGGGLTLAQGEDEVSFFLPVRKARSHWYRDLLAATEPIFLQEEMRVPVGGEEHFLEVIRCREDVNGVADDNGAVLRLHCQGGRVLFTGDAGFEVEHDLLENYRDHISCEVVVMGRHREHGYSGTADFLRATGCQAVIVSGADYPSTEKVPAWWRKMVNEMGIELFWQKETGAVLVDFGPNLRLRGFLNGRMVELGR